MAIPENSIEFTSAVERESKILTTKEILNNKSQMSGILELNKDINEIFTEKSEDIIEKKATLRKWLKILGFYKCLRKIISENFENKHLNNKSPIIETAKSRIIDAKCRQTFLSWITKIQKILTEENEEERQKFNKIRKFSRAGFLQRVFIIVNYI